MSLISTALVADVLAADVPTVGGRWLVQVAERHSRKNENCRITMPKLHLGLDTS